MVRYGTLDTGELGCAAAMFDPPQGAFLVAHAGDAGPPVGGVGLRTVARRTGQVRRLWVDPARQGRGIGRALMAALEVAARDLGLSDLQLSTGNRQPEAVALYEATGWERLHVDREEPSVARLAPPLRQGRREPRGSDRWALTGSRSCAK